MTTKLKIDLNQGILEVEGSESFVKIIYNDFKTHFAGIETVDELKPPRRTRRRKIAARESAETTPAAAPEKKEDTEAPPVRQISAPVVSYTLLEGLQLDAGEGRPSLVEFMDAKFPLTNEERNIVFLYYLQYTLKIKGITPDHIFTCYNRVKIRAPLSLENSLHITAEQKGWIRTTKAGKISLTAKGKQYVEKQLPKRVRH